MSAIKTENLTHEYKRHFWSKANRALDNLNIEIDEGEIFGYLGANGAGKTTTIKILVGLHTQTSGKASIFGIDTHEVESRKLVGFQPENPYFYEYLSAVEALRFYGSLCGIQRNERQSKSEELLEFVGLGEAKNVRVGDFSKGMRQRLGIAQAIIHKPKLVILDEPMSGLDPVGRMQVREIILRLREQGFTVFFSSHILADVEMVADRVALLAKGKLTRLGKLSELLEAKVNSIEVVASGIENSTVEELKKKCRESKFTDNSSMFIFSNWDDADYASEKILNNGGKIRGVRPIKETLEEYFMRENNISRSEAGAWSGGADK